MLPSVSITFEIPNSLCYILRTVGCFSGIVSSRESILCIVMSNRGENNGL